MKPDLIPIKDIATSGIRFHDRLEPELRKRAAATYTLGKLLGQTLDEWVDGFLKDMHPGSEIKRWEDIESAYLRYMAHHPTADQKQIVGGLVAISMGVKSQVRGLRKYYSGKIKPIRVFKIPEDTQ